MKKITTSLLAIVSIILNCAAQKNDTTLFHFNDGNVIAIVGQNLGTHPQFSNGVIDHHTTYYYNRNKNKVSFYEISKYEADSSLDRVLVYNIDVQELDTDMLSYVFESELSNGSKTPVYYLNLNAKANKELKWNTYHKVAKKAVPNSFSFFRVHSLNETTLEIAKKDILDTINKTKKKSNIKNKKRS